MTRLEQFDYPGATAIATVLLAGLLRCCSSPSTGCRPGPAAGRGGAERAGPLDAAPAADPAPSALPASPLALIRRWRSLFLGAFLLVPAGGGGLGGAARRGGPLVEGGQPSPDAWPPSGSRCWWRPSRCRSTPSSASPRPGRSPASASAARTLLLSLIDLPFGVSPVIAGMIGGAALRGAGAARPVAAGPRRAGSSSPCPASCWPRSSSPSPSWPASSSPSCRQQGTEEEEAALVMGASGWQISAPGHPAQRAAGACSTASSSATRGRWASSAPSRWSPATSAASPTPSRCTSRSSTTSTTSRAAFAVASLLLPAGGRHAGGQEGMEWTEQRRERAPRSAA